MEHSFRHIRLTATVAAAPQLLPEDMTAVAAAGFKTIINNRPDGEVVDQPTSEQMRTAAECAGLRYVYYPLNAFNYPGEDTAAVRELFDDAANPALAFCRSGTRSANLWISSRHAEERDAARVHVRQLGFDVSMSLAGG
jgi:sulfide:quinone oxidoreductase